MKGKNKKSPKDERKKEQRKKGKEAKRKKKGFLLILLDHLIGRIQINYNQRHSKFK